MADRTKSDVSPATAILGASRTTTGNVATTTGGRPAERLADAIEISRITTTLAAAASRRSER